MLIRLLYEYKRTLRTLKKSKDRLKAAIIDKKEQEKFKMNKEKTHFFAEEQDIPMLNSMINSVEEVIQWLESGRDPLVGRRGADKHDVYKYDPSVLDKLGFKTDIEIQPKSLSNSDMEKIEDALCTLTKREKEIFILIKVDLLTYSEVSKLLKIEKSTVQKYIERAKNKIEKRKSESLFLV